VAQDNLVYHYTSLKTLFNIMKINAFNPTLYDCELIESTVEC